MIKKMCCLILNNFKIFVKILKRSNKSFFKIIIEIINYKKKYLINLEDYLSFQFYDMSEKQVSTFYTYKLNDRLIDNSNDASQKYLFNNKEIFDIIFNDYLGRDWYSTRLLTEEKLIEFVKGKEYIFYKKINGQRGIGAKKLRISDFYNIKCLYKYLKSLDNGIIEEVVKSHKEISKICDSGLSTIRVLSYNNGKKCIIPACVFMIINGNIVNCEVSGGGLSACINPENGKVITDAVDVDRHFYEKHPLTGEKIKGFQIPCWNQVISLIAEVYNKIPGINYIGWDIAITNNGPIIIEGNASWPSHRIWQIPYLKAKHGKKIEFEKKINSNK